MTHYHAIIDRPIVAPSVIRDCFPTVAAIVRPRSLRTTYIRSARFNPLASGESTADVTLWCADQSKAKYISGCVVDSGCSTGVVVPSVRDLPSDFSLVDKLEAVVLSDGSTKASSAGPVRLQISGTSTSAEVQANILLGSQSTLGCESWRYPGFTVALFPTGRCAMIEPGHSLLSVYPGQPITPEQFTAKLLAASSFSTFTFSFSALPTSVSELSTLVTCAFSVVETRSSDFGFAMSLSSQVRFVAIPAWHHIINLSACTNSLRRTLTAPAAPVAVHIFLNSTWTERRVSHLCVSFLTARLLSRLRCCRCCIRS